MKKLLLLLFLVACTFMVAQAAIPAIDQDVGNVTYVMPTTQINQSFVLTATLPVMQTLYIDTGTQDIQASQYTVKQLELCAILVIPYYKGPGFSLKSISYPSENKQIPNFS